MSISFLENAHPDLEPTSTQCDFTVHRFALRPLAQPDLLSLGAKLIQSSSSKSSGWVNARVPIISFDSGGAKNIYQLAMLPPTIEKAKYTSVENLKEWGVAPDPSEIFCLSDLEHFISTNLGYLANLEAASTSLKRKASPTIFPAAQEPPRKSLKLDEGPLHKVIPYPHMHPPKPINLAQPPMKVPAYHRTKPIPIPPHTNPLPAPLEHARNAWVIPVRGILPFDFCTRAAIFDSSHSLSLPSPPTPNVENKITWTRPALVAFWTYLLRLRDAGSLGALGVSFHAAPGHRHGASSIASSACEGDQTEIETESVPSLSPLSVLDHIKVYHDATNAMYVRNALDVWAYTVPGQEHKIRVLKYARLVLVDERAKGVLVS